MDIGIDNEGQERNSEENLSRLHSLHQESHTDCPTIEPGSARWDAKDTAPEPRYYTT